MFKEIFLFELRYRLNRPATYLYFFLLFLYGCVTFIKGWVPGSEKAFINSSYVIHMLFAVITVFATLISSAIMGVPVFRDIEHNTRNYYLSYPISEKAYLMGRYLGSFVILFLVVLGIAAGALAGTLLGPIIGSEEVTRYGPIDLSVYANATVIYLLPNLFFTGTLFFSLVALTRKIFVAYTGSVLFFIGYLLANALTSEKKSVPVKNRLGSR